MNNNNQTNKHTMKQLFGLFLVIAGVFTGLYCGIWWAFIGGICALIEAIKATSMIPMDVAVSIFRILFATCIGWASAMVLIVPGLAIIKSK